MKISEVIAALQEIQDKEGDLPCFCYDDEFAKHYDIASIEMHEPADFESWETSGLVIPRKMATRFVEVN